MYQFKSTNRNLCAAHVSVCPSGQVTGADWDVCRPHTLVLSALFILTCALCVMSCIAQRQIDLTAVNAIRCEFTFFKTEPEDADRIAAIVERYRLEDFSFFQSVGDDSIYCEFTVASLADIEQVHSELRHLPEKRAVRYSAPLGGVDNSDLVFAQFDPVLSITYRAALLEGGMLTQVQFRITPGARLFYAAEGDYEEEVGEIFIDDDGFVKLPVSVQPGQLFVYGRTVLGSVTKCIRIYIYTGETEKISLEEYRQHVLMPPGTRRP